MAMTGEQKRFVAKAVALLAAHVCLDVYAFGFGGYGLIWMFARGFCDNFLMVYLMWSFIMAATSAAEALVGIVLPLFPLYWAYSGLMGGIKPLPFLGFDSIPIAGFFDTLEFRGLFPLIQLAVLLLTLPAIKDVWVDRYIPIITDYKQVSKTWRGGSRGKFSASDLEGN